MTIYICKNEQFLSCRILKFFEPNGACTVWIASQATSKPLIHGAHRSGQENLGKLGGNSFWKSRGKMNKITAIYWIKNKL